MSFKYVRHILDLMLKGACSNFKWCLVTKLSASLHNLPWEKMMGDCNFIPEMTEKELKEIPRKESLIWTAGFRGRSS